MRKILPWIFPVFCGLCVFTYMPHFSALIFAVGCILSLPISPIREFLTGKGLSGKIKGILLAAILLCGVMVTPSVHNGKGAPDRAKNVVDTGETGENLDAQREKNFPGSADISEPETSEAPTSDVPDEDDNTLKQEEQGKIEESVTPPETNSETEMVPNSETTPANQNNGGNGNNLDTYDNEDQQKTTYSYVLNSGTMKFHKPSCNSVKKIAPDNYSTYEGPREEVIAKGYDPCGNCHP